VNGLRLWLGAGVLLTATIVAVLTIALGWDGLATGKDPVRAFPYGRHSAETEDCGVILGSEAS